MTNIDNLKENRENKLKKIIEKGINPYPAGTKRSHKISEAVESFEKIAKAEKEVVLAGRLKSLRGHGGVLFFDLDDGSGTIQVLLRKDKVGEKSYQFFDIGDFVEVKGVLLKTKTGEKSILTRDFKILSKSLRPLPEKWHGLKNIEERYRKRYLDLIFNPEIRKKFRLRSTIIKKIREFLEKEEFLEVETPILQPIYGGARARPFKTHLNALDMDLYLRISPELYLKRLLVGGFEKVYEIGKCFRNEGMDKNHNPDFTMLEFYWAYADYKAMMKLTEKMFQYLLKEIFNKFSLEYQEEKISFKIPWERINFNDLLEKETKIKFKEINREALAEKAKAMGIPIEEGRPKAEIADEIYKKVCRPKIQQPTFIIHHPLGFQPLAKSREKESEELANFQLVIGGVELVNAFSELNDPREQRRRFKEQEKFFKSGLAEAQRLDEDYLEALEYAMPPAAGFGMGLDRLVALLSDSNNLREVILFPTMRPKS
jgi:lysyl-tRNA synthetase class 2